MEPDTTADVGGYEGVVVEGKMIERMRELGFVDVSVGFNQHVFRYTAVVILLLQRSAFCV
jgi:hypothetical protein